MKKLLLLAAVSAVSLAGCAQQPQTAIDDSFAKLAVCQQAVAARPEFAAFHMFAGATAAQLADDHYPSPEQARATLAAWDATEPCRQAFLSALASPPANRPDAAQLWAEAHSQWALLVANYSKGNMTVAEFTRRKQEIFDAVRSRLAVADAQAQQAAASRAVAAAAIFGAMHPQPQTIYVRPCTIYGQIANAC